MLCNCAEIAQPLLLFPGPEPRSHCIWGTCTCLALTRCFRRVFCGALGSPVVQGIRGWETDWVLLQLFLHGDPGVWPFGSAGRACYLQASRKCLFAAVLPLRKLLL